MANNTVPMKSTDSWIVDTQSGLVNGVTRSGTSNYFAATKTLPAWPTTVAQNAFPMIIPPGNGSTIGLKFTDVAGAFSLTTSVMPVVYTSAYLYMPIGAFDATEPLAAGWYYATFSSTSVGQLYMTTYTGGAPTIPTVLVKPVTTLNRWLTQTTAADLVMQSVTIPGGSMGANGMLQVSVMESHLNSAGAKLVKLFLGGTAAGNQLASASNTTTSSFVGSTSLRNRGSQAVQIRVSAGTGVQAFGVGNTSATANDLTTLNTETNLSLTAVGQIAVNTDFMVLEGWTVQVVPAA